MVFSSIVFLLFFLPSLLAVYFLVPKKYREVRNLVLLFFSIIFYAWGGLRYLWLLLLSVLVNYICGLFAAEGHSRKVRTIAVWTAAIVGIGLLGWYKYAGFFATTINQIGISVPIPKVVLPIGISFFTFQGLSYVIDVYRSDVPVQKNPFAVALYVILFPQLVAGPIVRYTTVAEEIYSRKENLTDFADGTVRFILGLGKKMLLANSMAEVADAVFALPTEGLSVSLAWLGVLAYTFQIYFDFSAYSDMAIGLGRMFGFHFLENFNYPYISKTVTEFWRRWHISLSTWFRDYVYIPLGGNRKGLAKQIRNIIVVWFLTGFWHGAAWTFIAWGLWFCILLLGEKFIWKNALEKLPDAFGHLYTILAVIIGWVFFRSVSMTNAVAYLGVMFSFGNGHPLWCKDTVYYLLEYGVYFILCILGSFPWWQVPAQKLQEKKNSFYASVLRIWTPKIFAFAILFLSYMKLATGSFNPFIYFQF